MTVNPTSAKAPATFFSILADTIQTGKPIAFDIYINSSGLEHRERFVRVYPRGETLSADDLDLFRRKYRQFYVPEEQRQAYLRSIVDDPTRTDAEKTTVLRDTAVHYLSSLFEPGKEFSTEILNDTISGCRDLVGNMVDVLQKHSISTLKELIASLSYHDFYTFDHSINVAMYNILICRLANPKAEHEELTLAGLGGLLHDLGKILIPLEIINKSGRLSDEEFAQIRRHPDFGSDLLNESIADLPETIDPLGLISVVLEHHENYDGTGYPRGLQGEEIHFLARVTAVSDFFDAVTTKRAYHEPISSDNALKLMEASVGKKLDPEIFRLFADHIQHRRGAKPLSVALPADFDPCQPHDHLPLTPVNVDDSEDHFGDIRVIGSADELARWASHEKVKLIDEAEGKQVRPAKTGKGGQGGKDGPK